MTKLTKRQAEIFKFIEESFYRNNISPTFREIAGNFNISVKAAYDHVKALEKRGWLFCRPNQARSIFLQQTVHQLQKIPVVNRIQPDTEIIANATVYFYELLEGRDPHNCFGFYMGNHDMQQVGIQPDDLLIIDTSVSIREKSVAAVLIHEDIYLRECYPKNNLFRVATRRMNGNDKVMYVSESFILGGLVKLVRNYHV